MISVMLTQTEFAEKLPPHQAQVIFIDHSRSLKASE